MLNDNQKIGILLTGLGMFFTFLGVILFFDRALLALGNLLFLAGVTLVIGSIKTLRFFFQKRKLKGSLCFIFGILLVLLGWAFVGLLLEGFGFINLFGDFFPIAFQFIRRIPILGMILDIWPIKQVVDRIVSVGRLPV